MIRILVATDEKVLAESLAGAISPSSGLSIEWGSLLDGSAANLICERRPDVALVDFVPAECLGKLWEIFSQAPAAKVVLWVRTISFNVAYQAMQLGVSGILRKSLGLDLTIRCLQKVAAGERWFEQDLADAFLSARTIQLTPRESQLIGLVSQGLRYKEIAEALSLAEGTVRMYLSALYRKVGVKDRYELAIFGLTKLGMAAPPAASHGSSLPVQLPRRLRTVALEMDTAGRHSPADPLPKGLSRYKASA